MHDAPKATQRPRPERGQPWRCPHCGQLVILVQTAAGFVPAQPVMVRALSPIANIASLYGADGQPLTADNLSDLARRSMFRGVEVLVSHALVCEATAKAQGLTEAPLLHTLEELEEKGGGDGA